ncbi:MAG TPA: hypothetical protein VMT63_09920 [Bacteroidales bacterium]|nr:hypothetical protein [Bacteroidales bacterium]
MRFCFILSVIFIFLVSAEVRGQQEKKEDRILFRGVVISASSGERLGGSKVLINRSLSGITRDDGTFSFFASRHDTIVFDMMGYKASRLIVADSLRSREFLTGIYMQADTSEIGEVVIIPNLAGLKAEMMNPARLVDQKMENAKDNLNVSSYQGLIHQDKLGDPLSNYEVLRLQQKVNAYEKGGIPSSRMVAVSPLLLLPAAYLLLHGPPETPSPPAKEISQKDLNDISRKYLEIVRSRKGKLARDSAR